VRSDEISLRSSASSASALRCSRIARRYPANVDDPEVHRWATSGAMALTGWPDEPLGPPHGLVEAVDLLARSFPAVDGLALLGERAALMGLWRRGSTSCGGSCRLLPCADGFLAVSLPRDEDMDMVPAWLELDSTPASAPARWSAVAAQLRHGDPQVLTERAQVLGLPVALVGETGTGQRAPVVATALGDAPPRFDLAGMIVIDLSALWAGPLCGDLLARSGATVIKVESAQRPDGARRGAQAFFDLLNGHKQSVALDLQRPDGIRILHALVQRSDVVIEASRPRALAQLGLKAAETVTHGGPQVWLSITGHGRTGEGGNRVAFGDDAAAAGGLVTHTDEGPLFCADAVADPLTGLTAADACVRALQSGGRWLLDVSMAAVSAALSGPTLPATGRHSVTAPHARTVTTRASAIGADTSHVLAVLGIET
jgi:CoA-transferase family III